MTIIEQFGKVSFPAQSHFAVYVRLSGPSRHMCPYLNHFASAVPQGRKFWMQLCQLFFG